MSELLRENQQGGKITPSTQIRVNNQYPRHIETSQMMAQAGNQLAGFSMIETLVVERLT